MTSLAVTIGVCVHRRDLRQSCWPTGGEDLVAALERCIADQALDLQVETIKCFGRCADGPNVRIIPGGPWYHQARPETARSIVADAQAFALKLK